MSKTNISFNNKNYQIDDASLSTASAALKSHLSTVMNGSGAVINLDGVAYGVDSTKLATATNAFVSHLGTIAGSGHKVMVNGVEYGIDSAKMAGAISEIEAVLGGTGEERLEGDGAEYYTLAPTALSFRSTAPLNELQEVQINGVTVDPSNYTLEEGSTIVTFPIEYLKTLDVGSYEVTVASDSKTVKGDFTVAAPELNEHCFYYNQPYSANLPMFGGDTAFFVREDGTYDIITVGKIPETGEYTMNGNNIVATHPMLGTITCTISSDGTEVFCNELQVAFKLNGSIAITADDDYVYEYKEDLGGYEVRCIDKTKAEYGAIKTGINGIDTVKLCDRMFYRVDGVESALTDIIIPDSVTSIGDGAFSGCRNLTSVIFGENSQLTNIGGNAFIHCHVLTGITIPDSVISIGDNAFADCFALTDIIIPDSVTSIGSGAFSGCQGIKNFIIGNGITSISGGLFNKCLKITNIDIHNNIRSIGYNAFYNCDGLTSITIPNSVTSIGGYAFADCNSLTSIVFSGTIEQWNAITFNDGNAAAKWNKNCPATHVQCSDGQVAL